MNSFKSIYFPVRDLSILLTIFVIILFFLSNLSANPTTKNLLYVKVGTPSDWTISGVSGSQYKEIQAWQTAGYTVTTRRLDSITITSALLNGYEILRLNGSQGVDKSFTLAEATAIYNWVSAGGKILADIVCDSNVTAVKQFGVNNVSRGAAYFGYWNYGGAPLRTTIATGPASSTGIVTFECMGIPSLTAGSTLKIAATYDSKPAIVYGQFGSGKVVINFTSGWSHDATWPGDVYQANINQESNIAYLQNVITYFTTTTKNLLYLKSNTPSTWTVSGASGSQYREIQEWQSKGYTVVTQDFNTTTISSTLLNGYSIVRITGTQSEGRTITSAEGSALYNWVIGGGKLLIETPVNAHLAGVSPFGVTAISPGAANFGLWDVGGAPLNTSSVSGPGGTVTSVAFECMGVPSLNAGTTLTTSATYGNRPAVEYGQFGSGRVVIVFIAGWSHDATFPGNVYQANIFQSNNIQFLVNVIGYLGGTTTKNLLYLKVGSPSDWTVASVSGSQYKEIQAWQAAGYTVTTRRLDSISITSTLLSGYDIVRLNTSQGPDKSFSNAEATAISLWVTAGGKLFSDIVCDSNVSAVKQFGISNVTRGSSFGYWTYGGAPLRTTVVTGPVSTTGMIAFEVMNVASLTVGSTLKTAATYDSKPAIVYGQIGSGKVVINFTSGWSHDATWPGNVYQANINQESNIAYLQNVITYFTTTTFVNDMNNIVPKEITLLQNYPNPFNPSTTIQYGLPARSSVRLVIYNILGQAVKELINTEQQAGIQSVVWNANVSSGLYFYRLEATSIDNSNKRFVETKKMLLLK
jgi:hypothetical protein